MFGHLGINVEDLTAAKNYCDVLMSTARRMASRAHICSSTLDRAVAVFTTPDRTPAFAFRVQTRSRVNEVTSQWGGQVLHPPQTFPQYPQPYFATFRLDPWGVMLEAVCHYDRD